MLSSDAIWITLFNQWHETCKLRKTGGGILYKFEHKGIGGDWLFKKLTIALLSCSKTKKDELELNHNILPEQSKLF